jgi:hypothetical protein
VLLACTYGANLVLLNSPNLAVMDILTIPIYACLPVCACSLSGYLLVHGRSEGEPSQGSGARVLQARYEMARMMMGDGEMMGRHGRVG